MFRFFSHLTRKKIANNAVNSATAQEQIQQMLKNPIYSKIITDMQKQTSSLKPKPEVKNNDFSVEKIEELLRREEENTKFSIY